MGLDMYLWSRRHVFDDQDESVEVRIPGHIGRVVEIKSEVGYWRKANHIHGWFVRNVQSGKDDCREYDVTKTDIRNLLVDCTYALNNRDKIESGEYENQLPPTRGCFFGNYDINIYYWQDIERTRELCEQLLSSDDFWKYNRLSYQSSW